MEQALIGTLMTCFKDNRPVALITVTQAQGSIPRGVGSMMIVDDEGTLVAGTIGGGAVEAKAMDEGAMCIRQGISKQAHYELTTTDRADSLNMICGGNVDIFIQVFKEQEEILIVGAGHIGHTLSRLAKVLGYRVAVADSREAFASRERFPEADILLDGEIGKSLKAYPIGPGTNIVILTHGHIHDQEALEAVIHTNARYIGMIGSRKKIKGIFDNLRDQGVSEGKLEAVHAPIGIDIGGETPEEISLGILAEIQAIRNGKNMLSLRGERI